MIINPFSGEPISAEEEAEVATWFPNGLPAGIEAHPEFIDVVKNPELFSTLKPNEARLHRHWLGTPEQLESRPKIEKVAESYHRQFLGVLADESMLFSRWYEDFHAEGGRYTELANLKRELMAELKENDMGMYDYIEAKSDTYVCEMTMFKRRFGGHIDLAYKNDHERFTEQFFMTVRQPLPDTSEPTPASEHEKAKRYYDDLDGSLDSAKKHFDLVKMLRYNAKDLLDKAKQALDRANKAVDKPTKHLGLAKKLLIKIKKPFGKAKANKSEGKVKPLNSISDVCDWLEAHPNIGPFLRPVSEDEAPGYGEVIEEPMSMSSLQKRNFKTKIHFLRNVRLIFDNCRLYNDPDDHKVDVANELENDLLIVLKASPKFADALAAYPTLAPEYKSQTSLPEQSNHAQDEVLEEARGACRSGAEEEPTVPELSIFVQDELPEEETAATTAGKDSGKDDQDAPILLEQSAYAQNELREEDIAMTAAGEVGVDGAQNDPALSEQSSDAQNELREEDIATNTLGHAAGSSEQERSASPEQNVQVQDKSREVQNRLDGGVDDLTNGYVANMIEAAASQLEQAEYSNMVGDHNGGTDQDQLSMSALVATEPSTSTPVSDPGCQVESEAGKSRKRARAKDREEEGYLTDETAQTGAGVKDDTHPRAKRQKTGVQRTAQENGSQSLASPAGNVTSGDQGNVLLMPQSPNSAFVVFTAGPRQVASRKRGRAGQIEQASEAISSGDEHESPAPNKRTKISKATYITPPNNGPSQPSSSSNQPGSALSTVDLGFAMSGTRSMSAFNKRGRSYRPWYFGHRSANGYGIYAIKCPKKGCGFFKQHPLKNNIAADHLTACGLPFTDEDDIVRRYAIQVVSNPTGKPQPLSIDWARSENAKHPTPTDAQKAADNFPEPVH